MRIVMAILLIGVSSWAAGNFNLSGTLRSFDKEKVEVQDIKKIYVINRRVLGPAQDLLIKQTKFGNDITLSIPFEAVEKVKLLEEKKK